ncbi:MAG: hypothetical protein GF418_13585, partial [Chitinivibrionales bacterium]|nr:hypothetical protein [Chitinivibrionales bacterium]MBD3396652.1 hypothetical protein [Chitinivibrionales bacterium]
MENNRAKGRRTSRPSRVVDLTSATGTWRLQYALPGEGLPSGFHKPHFDDRAWIDAPVPGDNHTALRQRGVTYGSFDKRDEREDPRWIEKYEWWYRRSFFVPRDYCKDSPCKLVFDGLDTLATVFLNGRKIHAGNNMHHPASVDVGRWLSRSKRNVIAVRFDPPGPHADSLGYDNIWTTSGHDRAMLWIRKCQMQFGWDFHPRHVTCGIWKGVQLVPLDRPRIAHIKVLCRNVTRLQSEIEVVATIDGACAKNTLLRCRIGSLTAKVKVVKPR